MKSYVKNFLLASPLAFSFSQLVGAKTTVLTSAQELKPKFFEVLDKDTLALEFKVKSSVLEDEERKKLESLVNAVRAESKVSLVIVASWADKDYPANKGQTLGSVERKLSDARGESVKSELHRIGIQNVEAHSMAEQPSWIGKMLNTNDAVVKGAGVVESANDKLVSDLGRILKENGGPGKVVVIVRRQGEYEVR